MNKTDTTKFRAKLEQSIKKVEKWVEDHNYKGYEPFDGLSSFLRPLTFGNLFLDRILMQLVRQCPINLRPLLGIKSLDSTIGRGYMAWGYLHMLKVTGDDKYEQKAIECLEWLKRNKSPGYDDYAWGKHFDFASRGGRYPKLEPITVWTVLIGQAILDAYELLDRREYLEVARSICNWILGLGRTETEEGTCISYTASDPAGSTIHNHNMLAAAYLARTARYTSDERFIELAREIMRFCCSKQRPDGSWYYGEAPNNHWIDNFHTGYNLDALKCYIEVTGDDRYMSHLKKGFEFYKNHFFEETGRPRYYHNRTYPVDSQCASQAIDTLANFSEIGSEALDLAKKVAEWTIDNMQDTKGYFYYRQYPLGIKAKTPMLHWAEATTYKGLALLLDRLLSGA